MNSAINHYCVLNKVQLLDHVEREDNYTLLGDGKIWIDKTIHTNGILSFTKKIDKEFVEIKYKNWLTN